VTRGLQHETQSLYWETSMTRWKQQLIELIFDN